MAEIGELGELFASFGGRGWHRQPLNCSSRESARSWKTS
jgi:hypothetical protein